MTGDNSNSLQTAGPQKALSPSQRREIVKLLFANATVLGENLNTERIDLLTQMLSDLPFAPLRDCLKYWALSHKWFPKPAEIREAILGNEREREEAQALEAWEFTLRTINQFWHTDLGLHTVYKGGRQLNAPAFDGRTLWAIRVCGGIDHIGEAAGYGEISALDFMKKQFLQAYKQAPAIEATRQARLERGRQDRRALPSGGFTSIAGSLAEAGEAMRGAEKQDKDAPPARQVGSGGAGS